MAEPVAGGGKDVARLRRPLPTTDKAGRHGRCLILLPLHDGERRQIAGGVYGEGSGGGERCKDERRGSAGEGRRRGPEK